MHQGTKGTDRSTTYRSSGGIPIPGIPFRARKSEGSNRAWARRIVAGHRKWRLTQDRSCYGCRGGDDMSLDALDQKTVDSLPHLPDVYDAYGVRVNALSVFFFQAEDGIRDHCVTGVQTCALPISSPRG